ncbi:RidA family protein [Azospirillum sp. A26]|uniref:RidA family protein n=1 Tax=Azospirillum sp. A26 TaxID=3160607 RepID=UPI003671A407
MTRGGMAMITRVDVSKSSCAATSFGGLVFLAGHAAEATKGRSVRRQTEEVLTRIDRTLATLGLSKAAILGAQIYIARDDMWAEMNEAWDAWVPTGCPAARACVEAGLADGVFVEISVTAAQLGAE